MEWFHDYLACPDCARDLERAESGARCLCGFLVSGASPIDLRPQHPVERSLRVSVGSSARIDLETVPVSRPEAAYHGPKAQRDSSELFSAVTGWMRPGATVLDLGCGPRDQADAVQYYGARYVGVDHSSNAADLLADAHAIPFRAATFDAVLSYAVFEHLYNPYLAAVEVARVLRDGGVFFGVVSQGEPYHESYFHHTSLGVLEMLRLGGLQPLRLWPSYDTLHALAVMGRYPKPQRLLIELVHQVGRMLPMLAPRKYFLWSEREKQVDELHRSASIAFVAQRSRRETSSAR